MSYDSRKLAKYSESRHKKIVSNIKEIIYTLNIPYQYLKSTFNGTEYDFFEYHTSKEEDIKEWYIMTHEGVRILEFYSEILRDGKYHDKNEIKTKIMKFSDQIKNQIIVYNSGTDTLVYVDKTQPPIKDNPKALADGKYIYSSAKLAIDTGQTYEQVNYEIEYICHSLSDVSNQFCHCFTTESTYSYYIMTQKGYDILQSYCGMQNICKPVKTIHVTDKNDKQILSWTQFKLKVLEPESNITFEPLKKYQPTGGNNIMKFNDTTSTTTPSITYPSLALAASASRNAPVAKSALTKPHCRELLDLWYKKSKINIYTATNAKCGELLEKDFLTQKIVQSLQTIRVLWGTDHPGEDNERQKQYEMGPGYYFERWMKNYNFLTSSDMNDAFLTGFNHITYTTATEKLLKGLEEKSKQLLKDLENKRAEIFLQINAADTYEQEIQILKAYGVLDTNGIISPAPADEITISLTSEE